MHRLFSSLGHQLVMAAALSLLLHLATSMTCAQGNDLTFQDPFVQDPSVVQTAAVQADGKAVIAGDFTSINGAICNHIARLNADGSLDPSFSSGTDGAVKSVVVQADGKVLLGGAFTNVNGVARSRIARLNADGSLDSQFDPGSGPDYNVIAVAEAAVVSVVAKGSASASESGGKAKFLVSRAGGDTSHDLVIVFKLSGTAKNGIDYVKAPTSVAILAGAESVQVKLKPVNDTKKEGTRTATLKLLASPDGRYTIGKARRRRFLFWMTIEHPVLYLADGADRPVDRNRPLRGPYPTFGVAG